MRSADPKEVVPRGVPWTDRPAGGEPRSILIVLPTWVGDFVMATPTLRAVRERFPQADITFVVEENLGDLILGGDWMDEVLFLPPGGERSVFHAAYRKLVAALRGRRFDLALLLPNSFRSALLAWFSGAKCRVGFDRDGRGLLLTDRISPPNRDGRRFVPRPIVEHYADLAERIGCPRPGDSLELFCTAEGDRAIRERLETLGIADRGPLVVISPGAKYGAAKCWPPERFAGVADCLIETEEATVVVTCGPGEESIARRIEEAMRRPGFVFDRPRVTLDELKSLIKRSDLLLCNDAGPRHFAKAFGVGVVTVFGPTHPEWTATGYEAERIVRIEVDCGPCQERVCPLGHLKCMEGITVDAVAASAKELLRITSGSGV